MTAEENSVHGDLRAEVLIQDLNRLGGTPCAGCSQPLSHHHALMSIAMGFKDAPRCAPCLAKGLHEDEAKLSYSLIRYISQRACFAEAWSWASRRSQYSPPESHTPSHDELDNFHKTAEPSLMPDALQAADSWDAGEQGCGELALELRRRIEALRPDEVFHLVARDLGVPEDLPAWCRLTGHTLLKAAPPEYWIQRKPSVQP